MTSPRAALVVATAIVAAAACARRAGGPGRVPAGPAFAPYPAAEIAGVRNPHAYRGRPLCQRCHRADLTLTNGPSALCRECHRPAGGGDHPVDVPQRAAAEGLPLAPGGVLACHTCHDPHGERPALRKPLDALCRSCHRGR